MFCKNCGLEISSDAKFCPGCGTAVEDTEVKNEVAFSEKAEENTVSPDVTENQRPDTESSIGNKPDEAEKDTVQAQPIESYSEPEQNDNEVIESANESKQSEIAKSDFPATDNIKEVLLPQKGKNGKVKFKDLPKKQKIIRIAIGGGLLLIALIWMISDGISGAKKAGNPSTEPEKTGSASIKTIAYDNDTGAVFDMSLEEFSDLFSEIYINMLKEYAPDKEIKENWNIKDYWSNKVEPQTGYQETSGAKFTMYNAIIDRTIITVSVIDKRIDNVTVTCPTDDIHTDAFDLTRSLGWVAFSVFSGLDYHETGDRIFDPVEKGAANNTMIYKDGVLFGLTVGYSCTAASEAFVKSLENAYDSENPPHVIYYNETDSQSLDDIDEITDAVENKNTIDFFGLIDKYISYSGSEGEGEFYLDIPSDDEIEYNGVYFVFTDKKGKESFDYYLWAWEIYNFDVIVDNKKVGTLSVNTGNEQHSFNYLSSGDSVYLAIEESCLEDLEQNNIFFLETEHEYIVPELGSFINSSVDLTEEDIARIKKDALSVGTRTSADSIIRRFNGVTESSETEIYFATIKGSTENEHNAKGFVVVVVPDKDKKQSYVVEYFDVYRQEDGSVTWGSQNSFMSEYHTENEIDKTKAIETYGAYSGIKSYSGYTFEKIG